MGHKAAIGIHHELPPGQTRVRIKAAQHKGAAGIDENFRVLIQKFTQRRHKDALVDSLSELLLAYLRLVLSRNHNGSDPHRLVILILYGHLRLSVWAEPFQQVISAGFG